MMQKLQARIAGQKPTNITLAERINMSLKHLLSSTFTFSRHHYLIGFVINVEMIGYVRHILECALNLR